MADDNKVEVKVQPSAAPPHAPGMTFQPTSNQAEETESAEPEEPMVPPAPELEPAEPVSEPPAAAKPAGPKESHVVAHPAKSAGHGFMRELLYLIVLLVLIVAGVLGAIYFLKI